MKNNKEKGNDTGASKIVRGISLALIIATTIGVGAHEIKKQEDMKYTEKVLRYNYEIMANECGLGLSYSDLTLDLDQPRFNLTQTQEKNNPLKYVEESIFEKTAYDNEYAYIKANNQYYTKDGGLLYLMSCERAERVFDTELSMIEDKNVIIDEIEPTTEVIYLAPSVYILDGNEAYQVTADGESVDLNNKPNYAVPNGYIIVNNKVYKKEDVKMINATSQIRYVVPEGYSIEDRDGKKVGVKYGQKEVWSLKFPEFNYEIKDTKEVLKTNGFIVDESNKKIIAPAHMFSYICTEETKKQLANDPEISILGVQVMESKPYSELNTGFYYEPTEIESILGLK